MVLYNIAVLSYDLDDITLSKEAMTKFYVKEEEKEMYCNNYNNNGCGCGGCTHFVRTNSVTLVGTVLVLNIPDNRFMNKEKVCICIAQTIPTVTGAQTVAITIGAGTTQYPLVTKCGNNVHADQIRVRKVYHANVATDTTRFIVSPCELCKTSFNFPILPVATTTVVEEETLEVQTLSAETKGKK